MEKELLKLAVSGDEEGVKKLLKTANLKQVLKHVHAEAVRGSDAFLPYFRAILRANHGSSEESSKCQFTIYQFGLNLLRQLELPLRQSSEVVCLLLDETVTFQSNQLAEVAQVFLDAIQDGVVVSSKWLEVFPKILMTLSSRPLVSFGGESWSGSEYKNHMIQKVLSYSWNPAMAVHLATTLRELALKMDDLSLAITKLLAAMNQMDVNDTPSLVYELLLLASKGHRDQVLEGIVEYFTRKDQLCQRNNTAGNGEVMASEEMFETLLQAEGTVILHVTFACKQDQELAKEFLRLLKVYKCNLQRILSPFCLSLALALTKIQRFEQQILDLLKGSVLCCFLEIERRRSSWWMTEVVTSQCHPSDALLTVANNSKHGWDHVTQGLLQLALDLLDAQKASNNPSNEISALAIKLLQMLFKVHAFVRCEILEQILNRRIMHSGATAKRYIDALGAIVGNSPNPSSFSGVRSALESLPYLQHASVGPLLLVLMPLLRISPALRDTLILVVRKSLFRRDVEARKVAVTSFLAIVKTHRILGGIPLSQGSSSSQVTVESSGGNNASNEALCLELLGILRRALTQQAQVRQTLYQGLPEVLEKNSQLSEPVLALLLEQLQKYCSFDDVGSPLKLQACIRVEMDQPQMIEPLTHLLQASHRCADKRDIEGQKLRLLLEKLVQAICKAELEDFELDKSSDYGNGPVGTSNRMQAEILLGVYEVLMEFCLLSKHLSSSVCEDVLSLFSGRQKVLEVLKDGQKKEEKKLSKTSASVLGLGTLANILDILFCKTEQSEEVQILKESNEFVQHLVSAVVQQVHRHKQSGDCSKSHFCTIGRALLMRYTQGDGEQQTLDALAEIICLYKNYPNSVLLPFLTAISDEGEERAEDDEIIKSFLQRILILLDESVTSKPKEALTLVCIVQALVDRLPQEHSKEAYNSVRALCSQHASGDVHVARSLVSVALTLGRRDKTWPTLLHEVAFAIRKTLGDIEECEISGAKQLKVIELKTAAAVVAPLLQHIDFGLDEITWAMGLPKQDVGREHAICSRLGRLVSVLKDLTRSALPEKGLASDLLLKSLTRFYTVVAALAKHYTTMYASKTGHLYSNFEKLVKLLGTDLTPNVYHFLTYIQVAQREAAPPNKALDCAAEKAKVLRESRTIPPLIFAIEQYEQCLIRLGKKSKVNLMAHVKLSTCRDFRINVEQVQATMAQEEPNQEEPRPKRPRNKLARKT